MKDLETCRSEIDEIDQQMLQLFEKRMGLSKQVVEYKLAHDMEIFQSNRETEVINETVSQLQNENLKEYAKNYIQDLMNISKSYQASFIPVEEKIELKEPKKDHLRVGFQGVPGAFSELALRIYFGEEAIRKHYTKFEDVY
ncbi:MAG: chorismate mutase, partial [Erysipelotrichaceae bacterium]|nr:chorismate mutase [Erysipelotrichaceae bacterium]